MPAAIARSVGRIVTTVGRSNGVRNGSGALLGEGPQWSSVGGDRSHEVPVLEGAPSFGPGARPSLVDRLAPAAKAELPKCRGGWIGAARPLQRGLNGLTFRAIVPTTSRASSAVPNRSSPHVSMNCRE